MNTFLCIDKPAGWTSFDCVAVVRKALGVKRVGHTGTLDPFATGLLLVAVGKCTKLIPFLEKDRKTYRTKILFNRTSETLDTESEMQVSSEQITVDSAQQIEQVLQEKFSGKIQQIPPKYSALKINGQRAYDLARKGKEFEMKSRETEILRSEILDHGSDWVELEIEVAAGFYVRSFARDLAEALGIVGMCGELRRIGVGELAVSGEQLAVLNPEDLKNSSFVLQPSALLDPREILTGLEVLEIPKERLGDWSHGRAVKLDEKMRSCEEEKQAEVLVTCNDKTIGLGLLGQGSLQPKIVF